MTTPPSDPQSRRDPAAAVAGLRREAVRVGLAEGPLAPLFERFLEIVGRFSDVEIRLLGSVPLKFPAHMYQGGGGAPVDPVAEGVELARRERERLGQDAGALYDPIDLVESQGIKVVQLRFPPGANLLGAFLFDAATGPAILLDAARPLHERNYAAVHFYGHFLADYDPFRTWVCRLSSGEEASLEETRARAFASAFLVPPEDLALYLREAGIHAAPELNGAGLAALRVYFLCDDRALIGGLLASGWLSAARVLDLVHEAGPLPAEEGFAIPEGNDTGAVRAPLPGRFVGMAVAAHHNGALTLAELARYLEVDEATALAVERSLTVPEERRTDAGSPA